mmetsp:Transcript_2706/g.6499  ORF Transcript_2706/g.6499 Transcript_2706/m.6499 type:complete len:238 (+) Transcript_2706:317-1030(+)
MAPRIALRPVLGAARRPSKRSTQVHELDPLSKVVCTIAAGRAGDRDACMPIQSPPPNAPKPMPWPPMWHLLMTTATTTATTTTTLSCTSMTCAVKLVETSTQVRASEGTPPLTFGALRHTCGMPSGSTCGSSGGTRCPRRSRDAVGGGARRSRVPATRRWCTMRRTTPHSFCGAPSATSCGCYQRLWTTTPVEDREQEEEASSTTYHPLVHFAAMLRWTSHFGIGIIVAPVETTVEE